jgi:hypothetical protein
MAAQEHGDAILLWEVAFRGRTSAKLKLVDMLERKVTLHMLRHQLDGAPRKVAKEIVAWQLHGTCQPCGGRGYEVVPDTPMLSDALCTHCQGTRKVPLPKTDAHTWLAAYVDKLTSIAGQAAMRKLHADF